MAFPEADPRSELLKMVFAAEEESKTCLRMELRARFLSIIQSKLFTI